MNETLKTIKNRRSSRSFSNQQIGDDELQRILEAAQYAPTGYGRQSWHFIVVQQSQLINMLSDASKEAVKNHSIEYLRNMANNKSFNAYYDAPTIIIICGDKNAFWASTDCAAATQNILLAAESIGLAACWVNFGLFVFDGAETDDYMKMMQIPEGYKPFYSVALGYRNGEMPSAAPRKKNLVTYIK